MEASVGGSENRVVWFHLHTFVVYLSLSVVTRSRFSLMVLSIMRWSFVIMFLFILEKSGNRLWNKLIVGYKLSIVGTFRVLDP